MNKLFLCKWGEWDELALNSYKPKMQEVTEDFFSEDNGYDGEDISAVAGLNIGESYEEPYGNHIISRLK
jgi:hypothetical protein